MLVTIKPRSYTLVNQLTVRELEQVFEFRKHVLGLAAKFAARNRTEDDLDKLAMGLERLTTVLGESKGDLSVQAFPASQVWDLIIEMAEGILLWLKRLVIALNSSTVPRMKIQEFNAFFNQVVHREIYFLYFAIFWSAYRVFHFHGFNDHERGAGLNFSTGINKY